jgi:hypothetical protein
MYVYSYFVWSSVCKHLIPLDFLFWQHFPYFVFAAKSIYEKKQILKRYVSRCVGVLICYLTPWILKYVLRIVFLSMTPIPNKIALAAVSKASPVYPPTWDAYYKKEFKKQTFVYIIHLHKNSVLASYRTQSVFIIRMIFVV